MKNSELLSEFQAEDVELAQQLLRLKQRPSQRLQDRVWAIPHQSRGLPIFRTSRLVWGGVALMLVIMLFLTSPKANAMLWQLEKVVGKVHLTLLEAKPTYSNTVVVNSTPMSLEQARAAVPFQFATPTHIPTRLNPNYEVSLIKLDISIVKILWRDTGHGFVQLTAHQYNGQNILAESLIGNGSSETISIRGKPAVVVYGAWDNSSQMWSYQDQLTTVIWNSNDIQYKLLAYNSVPLADLMAMAESFR